ncbi:penicillin-binding protein 1C [Pseudorhodoplanes sp.]|uniref:penicillin-binding protein 1C n=1 Tax=Pseudorhodoplanes sp. TaxID=1934341 RepID=UPI00391B6687
MRRSLAIALSGAALLAGGAFAAGFWARSLPPLPDPAALPYSIEVVGREGRLLRPYATGDGRWRLKAEVSDVDPRYLAMLIAYEDRRFYSHRGVDPVAVVRAAWQWAAHREIVSGASTLTMQVARLLEPRSERTLGAKLRQMVRAIALERALSKDEILSLYLSLAPYGGNLEGVRAASLAYFGKEPKRLSRAEAALLVALPQSPEARRPDRHIDRARRARARVLDRVAEATGIPADEVAAAKAHPVPAQRKPMPALAPHAADQAVAAAPDSRRIELTIDERLQRALEILARDRADTFGREVAVAIVAVEHASGEVLARVASPDFFDKERAGQVDLTRALRSPGSALKPFIYGLAFEDGLAHPETLIDDRPARYGSYAPENFDSTFQGTVPVRRALQLSLNVPAVALLERVGVARLTARLSQAGGGMVFPKGEAPGLAMGLGGVGVTLTDLTMLYAGLARQGMTVPLVERRSDKALARPPSRLLDRVAAWYVGHVLSGTPPPDNAARNRIAFKTGTSYGYRDAWAVGFDGRRTIGVWVGRPDGAPVPGILGRTAAAPILFDAFARTGDLPAPLAAAPKGAILSANGRLPLPLQRFSADGEGVRPRNRVRIMFPPNGARLELATADGRLEPVALKIAGGVEPLTVLVNGVPQQRASGRMLSFDPMGPGFVRLTVVDGKGTADSVMVRLQ